MSRRHKDPETGHPADAPQHPQDADPQAGAETGDGADRGADAAPAEASELEALKLKLAEKDREIAELKDKYLRALADGENARKRIRIQSEETIRLQREALLHDLLPVVDNLERAVEAERGGAAASAIAQGVELVLRTLLDFLRANGVTPVASVGQPFDPKRHEAVDHVESDAHPPNTVVGEFHRGYQIGERILRPARVSVAKGREAGGNSDDPGQASRNDGETGAADVEND